MATRIDGKALAAKVKGRVAAAVKTLPRRPGLAVVLVGDDPASQVYVRGKEAEVSAADSKVKIFVIPTNEELMIAMDTAALVSAAK